MTTPTSETIRLRLTEFVVDPNDPDVMRRVLEVRVDVLTFTDGELQLWRDGTELHSFPLASVAAVELGSGKVPAAGKTYSVEEIRKQHGNAYQRWTPEDEQLLLELHVGGEGVETLAQRFDRQPGAIRARLVKLGAVVDEAPAKQADRPPF
ncbi:hypothetical protein J7E96_28620 [Streptomyces sp. ISL-96]|uniref:hypothetical protein n=1 Tax=Streptomyces sp. ISL-96 TaxID=2819191 RepID=UPI001BE4EEC2|nr:hypothetical protein [Streptomyces sp. ISL-96]MBT2492404.1 hypothetical protein [Streptomyces sp. ISL-96]